MAKYRRGLGKGKGSGWKNIISNDPYRHNLSRMGVKSAMFPKKARYVVKIPATLEVGSCTIPGVQDTFMQSKAKDALWHYNAAREHDGLLPVKRLPRGTKYMKDSDGDGVPDSKDCQPFNPNRQDTNVQIGDNFFAGATKGKANRMEIVDLGDKTALVGYGWAVYGTRDKATGKVTYYKGWNGYSVTTSKQLGQTGLRSSADIVSEKKPTLDDIRGSDRGDMLKTTAMVAALGDIFESDTKEKNDWKKRMLQAGLPALDVPEDWDRLSESEKEKRLNKVIAMLKER